MPSQLVVTDDGLSIRVITRLVNVLAVRFATVACVEYVGAFLVRNVAKMVKFIADALCFLVRFFMCVPLGSAKPF